MADRAVLEEVEALAETAKRYGGAALSEHDLRRLVAVGLADVLLRLERVEDALDRVETNQTKGVPGARPA